MKIELKNVKYFAAGSEETSCFVATVYIDGEKAGEVSNQGHGGPNMYQPWSLQTIINEYAQTLPEITCTFDPSFTYQPDADTLIGDILNDYLWRRCSRVAETFLVAKCHSVEIFKEGDTEETTTVRARQKEDEDAF